MEGICAICGQRKNVHKNREVGKAVCQSCYSKARYRNPSTHEKCSKCGGVKPVTIRTETGEAICYNCYHKSRYPNLHEHKKCSQCGKGTWGKRRNEIGEAICSRCYCKGHHRCKIGECAKCEETKVIQALGLCYACYQRQRRAKAKS